MPSLPTYDAISPALPLRGKVGQLFMPAAFINDTEEGIRALEELIRAHHIGGLCFFHSRASAATNFEGGLEVPYHRDSLGRLKELIDRYQQAAEYPLLIAMDAEWGLAMRVEHAPQYPYAITLGALDAASDPLIYELGLRLASDCRDVGIHWNLSPVVDINSDPENPVISYRAFGDRPGMVERKALQLFRGLRDGGLVSCLKHYPGHGDTAVDSHLALPVLEKDLNALERQELVPFRSLIQAGAPAVMPGHLSLPALDPTGRPASLSPTLIGMLRERLGFEGVILSDALNMHALRSFAGEPVALNAMALDAGNDMLCFASEIPRSIDRIVHQMDAGRLESSFRRIWNLKEAAFNREAPPVPPRFDTGTLNRELARKCLCEVRTASRAIAEFRAEGFSLCFFRDRPDLFADRIRDRLPADEAFWGTDQAAPAEAASPNVLLALVPPGVKPAGNFGFPKSFFKELDALCERKNVVLYLFGNPYLLPKLNRKAFKGIICAFQPLEAFQESAADHFMGLLQAQGTLPIQLNDD